MFKSSMISRAMILGVVAIAAVGCTRKLKQENQELWALRKKLEADLDQSRREQDTLRESLADRDARLAGLRDTENQLRDREAEIARLKGASQALQEELAKSRTAAKNVEQELARLRGDLKGLGAEVSMRGGLVTITLTDDVQFGFAKAVLTDESKRTLRRIATVLSQRYPTATVRVDGHTDNVPVKKDASKQRWLDNWGLGADRALTVLRFLVTECGVKPDRIYAASFGETLPQSSNRTPEGRAKNRRVEIVILPGGAPSS